MSNEIDPAHILFPSDAPRLDPTLNYVSRDQDAAAARLQRRVDAPASPAAPNAPAGDKTDVAAALFKDDAALKDVDFERVVGGELDQVTLDAMKDGDSERANALKAATAALSEDFRAAGTDPASIQEAFQIVRQSADSLSPPTPEQIEEGFASSMAELTASGVTEADLGIARQMIRDLELISPGVVASLESHGAGNDPRLVRAAIKEAKRRGYR
ncbi:hypothetical protein [Mesorhizobium sp. M00.F.Ca.ET.217.01.1.1]|uniref:hypothetical protein n=1 Tax=Mesorhizobium sp. M00.F.Ca.ET.217.01.1.1 TaxID=2500529 RepID=UPI000FD6C0D6|nr:hypothetical protein [Mesorhizobium sp. M00.F.Ca.ET.217.01.1.1]TGQ15870.1 hypothetical protein EN860_025265 [Mesorhizobium sp. M00.F.Ca.ET.217.01.1.1]TGQ15875.1 hypothetical protein EN860_025295 [Mesorhizobium sp. M00.F.Ca.ET.217.01.1.1]